MEHKSFELIVNLGLKKELKEKSTLIIQHCHTLKIANKEGLDDAARLSIKRELRSHIIDFKRIINQIRVSQNERYF